MGIRKKMFVSTAATMLSILFLSYLIIYLYLYNTMFNETVSHQRVNVELNRQMANNFVQSTYHTATQLVSDKVLGEYLSLDSTDPLEILRTREAIRSQFSHYATHQVIDSTYYYKITLFLSDELPIASSFESYTLDNNPYASSNTVFSNEAVKEQDWYRQTVERVSYVFGNSDTDEFCIARKINNTYYQGPSSREGNAVMVVSVALDQFENVLSSIPVTANGGYTVLNQDSTPLFYSNRDISAETYKAASEKYNQLGVEEFNTEIMGEKYLVSHCEADYRLQFLFLTPHSDIVASISPLMRTYTLLFTGVILITLLVTYMLANSLSKPIVRLAGTIGQISDTRNFDKSTLHVAETKEIVALEHSFDHLIDNTNRLIEDIQIQGEREKRSQLRALQAQINPHFIFNAMDMVNWLALSRNCDDIACIVDSIANLIRYSITNADGMVTIQQEMDNIQEFVNIYQQRHNNSLHLTDHTAASSIMIPKFTLQPLVENAIRHAVPPQGQGVEITVTARDEKEYSLIEVSDNGRNCQAEKLNLHLQYKPSGLKVSGGFGIRNVNERIHLWFLANSGLTYYNREDGGLTARITLSHIPEDEAPYPPPPDSGQDIADSSDHI